jgi:hypothetical protein
MAAQPKRPTSTKAIVAKLKAEQARLKIPGRLAMTPKLSAQMRASAPASPLSPAQKTRASAMRAQMRAYFGR